MRKEAQKDQCTCPRYEFIHQVYGSWDLIPMNSTSHLGQVVPFWDEASGWKGASSFNICWLLLCITSGVQCKGHSEAGEVTASL